MTVSNLTRKEILKVFENFHVKPIEALGKPFDPNFHEAVMREESNEHPENTVVNELQKGYLMHDRLLRPSMVVVAMPKNKESPLKQRIRRSQSKYGVSIPDTLFNAKEE